MHFFEVTEDVCHLLGQHQPRLIPVLVCLLQPPYVNPIWLVCSLLGGVRDLTDIQWLLMLLRCHNFLIWKVLINSGWGKVQAMWQERDGR